MRFVKLISFLFFLITLCTNMSGQKSWYLEAGLKSGRLSPIWKSTSDIKGKVTPYVSLNIRRQLIKDQLYLHYGLGYQRVGETMEYSTSEGGYISLNHIIPVNDKYNSVDQSSDYRKKINGVKSDYDLYIDMIKLPLKVEYKWSNFQFMSGMFLTNSFRGKYKYYFVHPHYIYYSIAGDDEHNLITKSGTYDPNLFNDSDDIRINRFSYGFMFSAGYKWKRLGVILSYEQGLSYLDKADRTVVSVFSQHQKSSFQYRHPDFVDSEDGRLKLRNFSLGLAYYL